MSMLLRGAVPSLLLSIGRSGSSLARPFRHKLSTQAARMADAPVPTNDSYLRAIAKLDSLTGNGSARNSAAGRSHRADNTSRRTTETFCVRAGLRWPQLDALSVVHVTGTKGKGSTCAMVETVLRRCAGVRTGLFVSPHLIRPEERICIDGQRLDREKFARYFWTVFDALDASKTDDEDMPFYFQFLTVMAFHVFVAERVDCAIVEVGIGGQNDTTNVVRRSHCTAISSLGLEHTQLLGNTLTEIAWQKAGIAKPGATMFAPVDRLTDDCRTAVASRCAELSAELRWAPQWSDYRFPAGSPDALRANPLFRLNGSLAVQLAYEWLRRNGKRCGSSKAAALVERIRADSDADGLCPVVYERVAEALMDCRFAGRFQRMPFAVDSELFVDGAHTLDSVRLSSEWFVEQRKRNIENRPAYLLFNVTGSRDANAMLDIVREVCDVREAVFSVNRAWTSAGDVQKTDADGFDGDLEAMAEHWRKAGDGNGRARCFRSVEQAMTYFRAQASEGGVDVLVTGSLYMVGSVCEYMEAMAID